MPHNIDKPYKNINKSLSTGVSPSVFSHNCNLLTVGAAYHDGVTMGAEGVRYPAIVLQPTHTQWEQPKVTEKYPVLIPGTKKDPCFQSGVVLGATRCNDCKTVEVKVDHCEKWSCPVCGPRKVRRQAKRIVERMKGFKDAVNTSANPRHIVVSSKRWDGCTLEQMTRNANSLFSRYLPGLAGVYVVHMFRVRGWDDLKSAGGSVSRFNSPDNIKKQLRDYREAASKNPDLKCPSDFWTMIKEDILGLGSWRDYVYVSPHIHIIGWGKLPNSKKFYEDTGGENGGFIYKTKEKEGRSFDFYQAAGRFDFTSEILKTLHYLGGHAAIMDLDDKRHANRIFRAFGFCSVYKLKETLDQDYKNDQEVKRVSEKIIIDKSCPTCSSKNCVETKREDIHRYYKAVDFDDDYNPLDSEGDIIKELISPIHKFEWSWYHYHFSGYGVREAALKFAESLPRKKVLDPAGCVSPEFMNMGKLERLVMMGLHGYDRWKDNNLDSSVVVE